MNTKAIAAYNFFARVTSTVAIRLAVCAFVPFVLGGAPGAIAASDLAAQTSRGGGVDVKVTPRSLARDVTVWEFEVVFDTHSATLDGDPAQFSSLVDSQGRVYRAVGWKGDPPGGHHRRGTLQFEPIAGATEVELRIDRVAGVPTRIFRWRR